MRVMLVPSSYAPNIGGVEEATGELVRGLRQRGHDIVVVTNHWPSHLPTSSLHSGVTVLRLPFTVFRRRPSTWFSHWSSRRRVAQRLDELERPDVVHLHCVSGQASHVRRFCKRHHIPLVVTTHGETAMDASHLYQRSWSARHELRRIAAEAVVLTACSAWSRDHAASISPRFSAARVIENSVDIDRFSGLPEVLSPVFVAYGRLVPQKGFSSLLRAFAVVRTHVPQATLVIGGDGPLREAIEAAGGDGVDYEGALDRQGVVDLLAKARVVVVPSLIEPFGLVALEALASGRRLVFSNTGGLTDIGKGWGWEAEPGDVPGLAAAMVRSLTESSRSPSAEQLQSRFGWGSMVDAYERLLELAIDTRS